MKLIAGTIPVVYLALSVLAATAPLFRITIPFSTQPWQGWAMFDDMPGEHIHLVGRGHLANGTAETIDVDRFFPRSIWVTERSRAQEIRDLVFYFNHNSLGNALCTYILSKVNNTRQGNELSWLVLTVDRNALDQPHTTEHTAVAICETP